MPVDKLQHAV